MVVKLPRHVARQALVGEQLLKVGAENIGQQHAAKRGAVHRQAGADADLMYS